MSEPEVRAAIERIPPDLRALFLWLATGKTASLTPAPAKGDARNGTS